MVQERIVTAFLWDLIIQLSYVSNSNCHFWRKNKLYKEAPQRVYSIYMLQNVKQTKKA